MHSYYRLFPGISPQQLSNMEYLKNKCEYLCSVDVGMLHNHSAVCTSKHHH